MNILTLAIVAYCNFVLPQNASVSEKKECVKQALVCVRDSRSQVIPTVGGTDLEDKLNRCILETE